MTGAVPPSRPVVLATAAELPGLHTDDGPLLDALSRRHVPWRVLAWDDPSVDWSKAALVVIRSTWDYVPRRAEFVTWAQRVTAVTTLWNPAEVVAWNTDKRYLRRLADTGIGIVPTLWLDRGTTADLAALLDDAGWVESVVKPVVSAGSIGTIRCHRAEAAAAQGHLDALLAKGDVMVQPYVAGVETEGELSVVWIDGALTHAIRKVPRRGDFRVQEEFGGRYEPAQLDDDLRAAAGAVLAQVEPDCRYGRVDLVPAPDGGHWLIEVELVEPQLFLRYEPAAAERLADAIAAAWQADASLPRSTT
jgi:glutathione synthase/RimK-type ligase-like ATP-grasp enzyme